MIGDLISDLISLLREYHEPLLAGVGGVAGWYAQLTKARLQRQRNVIDAEQLENEQLALALNRERFLTDRLTVQGHEVELLWRRLYDRENVIKDFHSAALTAQRRVNELEIRAGLSATVFPDLPDFPPACGNKIAGAPADERGEHYDADGSQKSGPTGSPVGGRETPIGKTDNRPPA